MIILDANVLLYLHDSGSPFHERSMQWFRTAFEQRQDIALSWSVILAFLRISTNPAIFAKPRTMADALESIASFRNSAAARILDPGPAHFSILEDLLNQAKLGRDLVSDAHLAALAIENDAAICSHDRDFLRFKGLRVINPYEV